MKIWQCAPQLSSLLCHWNTTSSCCTSMATVTAKVTVYKYCNDHSSSDVASVDNWRGEDSYTVFCIINFFWNLLFLRSVNTNIFAPPIIDAGYVTELQVKTLCFSESKMVTATINVVNSSNTIFHCSFSKRLYWKLSYKFINHDITS